VAGKPRPYPSSLSGSAETRIVVHHGIWREQLTAIIRNSVESYDDGTRKWHFPSAVSEATHDEWTVCQILVHLGLFSDIKSLRADVTDFHARQGIVLTDVEITSFYSLRHDGVAFDDKNKRCVLLEFTRLSHTSEIVRHLVASERTFRGKRKDSHIKCLPGSKRARKRTRERQSRT